MKRRWLFAGLPLVLLVTAAWAGIMAHGPRLYVSATSGGGENTPFASQFSLEIIYPKAAGSLPLLDSDNRAFFAYTALTYEIPLAAIGGSYPYTWEVSGGEAGKFSVVEYTSRAGVPEFKLVYTDPQVADDTTDITVTVTDAVSATDSETYSITVGTSGWVFVDPVNDGSGDTGTISAPFDSLAQVRSSSGANSRVYFRTGTYTMDGMPIVNQDHIDGEERIEWNCESSTHGLIWIAYPGDSPTLDFEYTGNGYPYNDGESVPRLRFTCANTFIAGFTIDRPMIQAFQLNVRTGQHGVLFWDNDFNDLGPGRDGTNSGFLMWSSSSGSPSYGDLIVDNSFDGVSIANGNQGSAMLKLYGLNKALLSGNYFANNPHTEGSVAIKGDVLTDIVVRANKFDANEIAIGGNQSSSTPATADISYNLVLNSTVALELNAGVIRPQTVGRIDAYRNTFGGRVQFGGNESVETDDGPHVLSNNVVVNEDGALSPAHFWYNNVTDATRITLSNNLANNAAAAIIDANGLLQGASRSTYLGTRGHEIPE
jgi:hypothetical protein